MLTAKQEKFVRNLVNGMSQREAYKNSYDAENMTDESIDVAACRLFADDKVSLRYRELQERLTNASIMTAQERLEYLTGIVQDIEREHKVYVVDGILREEDITADFNTKIKAIDIMNKMQGEYTTKIEGSLQVAKLEDLI